MKIRIFVLGVDINGTDKLLDNILRDTFAGQFADDGSIEYYSSVKDAAGSIANAFVDSETVVFFAAPENYCAIKKVIARAFRFELTVNARILEMANRFAPESMKSDVLFSDTHALIPENAKAFVTSDGLFSGFGSVRGSQTVVFLPYMTERACSMLSTQVIPFINSVYSQSIPTEYCEHIYARLLHETIEREPVNIAMALTKTADLFCDYISSSKLLSECINKCPRSEERGTMRPSEYVVNLSIAAAELQGVPYGIVLSNAYYMDDTSKERLTVFMAVTNDRLTTVRELKSFAWETSSEFMQRCCGELCKLLNEIIEKDRGIGAEGTDDDPKKIHKYRSLAAITGAAIILLLIVGGYIFSSNSYSLKDWMHNHFPAVFTHSAAQDEKRLTTTAESKTDASDAAAESKTDTAENTSENTAADDAPSTESASDDTQAAEGDVTDEPQVVG